MKTTHIWMPDGRSLCDRKAHLHTRDVSKMSDSEFEQLIEETHNAPACGSCLLLAEYLRADAAVIYRMRDGNVYPQKPVDGWRGLSDTRWSTKINITGFLADPEVAGGQQRYERITDGIAPQRLQEWVDKETAAAEKAKTRLIDWRDKQRSVADPEDSDT